MWSSSHFSWLNFRTREDTLYVEVKLSLRRSSVLCLHHQCCGWNDEFNVDEQPEKNTQVLRTGPQASFLRPGLWFRFLRLVPHMLLSFRSASNHHHCYFLKAVRPFSCGSILLGDLRTGWKNCQMLSTSRNNRLLTQSPASTVSWLLHGLCLSDFPTTPWWQMLLIPYHGRENWGLEVSAAFPDYICWDINSYFLTPPLSRLIPARAGCGLLFPGQGGGRRREVTRSGSFRFL